MKLSFHFNAAAVSQNTRVLQQLRAALGGEDDRDSIHAIGVNNQSGSMWLLVETSTHGETQIAIAVLRACGLVDEAEHGAAPVAIGLDALFGPAPAT